LRLGVLTPGRLLDGHCFYYSGKGQPGQMTAESLPLPGIWHNKKRMVFSQLEFIISLSSSS
jgi:hypothetical protein